MFLWRPMGTVGARRTVATAWSTKLECRGGTYDRAGIDVIWVSLAVLHLQGDPGVIIWNKNGRNLCIFVLGMKVLSSGVACSVISSFFAYLLSIQNYLHSLDVNFHCVFPWPKEFIPFWVTKVVFREGILGRRSLRVFFFCYRLKREPVNVWEVHWCVSWCPSERRSIDP